MSKINRKLGIVQLSALLAVAFFAATPAASAGEVCELDWNCDGVVSDADVYEYVEGGIFRSAGNN